MIEHDFQKAFVKRARLEGYVTVCTDMMSALMYIKSEEGRQAFISYAKSQGYTPGQSDLILLRNGFCWFVELKYGKGKQTQAQANFAQLNANYRLITNAKEAEEFFQNERV